MNTSLSFKCANCGKVFTCFNEEAVLVHNIIVNWNALCRLRSKNRGHEYKGVLRMVDYDVACCNRPHVRYYQWDELL